MRLAPAVLLSIVSIGCGSTRPNSAALTAALPFRAGVYSLEFFGSEAVGSGARGSVIRACPGISRLNARGLVAADTMVRHDDATWHGVPASDADGVFDLQLTAGDGALRSLTGMTTWTTGPAVTGIMHGAVKSTTMLGPPDKLGDYQVTIAGENGTPNARLNGNVSVDGIITHGLVFGTVVFSNRAGVLVPCASGTVSWILSLEGAISSGVQ